MNRLYNLLKVNNKAVQVFVILLSIPALFINLGLLPLISDEPTRGAVTLEMLLSGNFILPSINGEYYFNKPPLFNWIQAFFIEITGSMDEWVFRLPTVLSTIGLCMLIYLVTRKDLKEHSVTAALTFIVAGRVLFWDSFMGLIDITYSLVTFGSFLWMIHFHSRNKYLYLFVGSYLLASIGFLMKGLPSIAFQITSILALLVYDKRFKKLLSWQHLAGILVFIVIVGGYYLIYSRVLSVTQAFDTLIYESNRIQSSGKLLTEWFMHLVEFPLIFIYEFAPVTLLAGLLLHREVRVKTFEKPFYRYCLLLFVVNIFIYWISADMRCRYLFMLFPLFSIIVVKAFSVAEAINTKGLIILRKVMLSGIFVLALLLMVYPIWNETKHFAGVWPVSLALMFITLTLGIIAYYNPRVVLLSLFGALLLTRIGFNTYNLPARINSYPDLGYMQGEIHAARLSAGHQLYIYKNTALNHDATFYITRERAEILRHSNDFNTPGAFYLVDQENLSTFAANHENYRVVYSFKIKLNESIIFLVKKL